MMKYSKQVISNSILRYISEGINNGDILDSFLMMKMSNDLGEENPLGKRAPSVFELTDHLRKHEALEAKDYERSSITHLGNPRLMVKLSPACTLYIENIRGILQVKVNNKNIATLSIRMNKPEDVIQWIIRQKQNLESYTDEWNAIIKTASKKAKGNRMSLLAIKAIFSESMKVYPDLEYAFIEQKRRLRIRVKLPDSKLGVIIDAWWGSYKERLPEQIEDLKRLIEVHKNTRLKEFFVSHR